MNIPEIGKLAPHAKIPGWLTSQPVAVPYFDGLRLTITLDGLEQADEADAAFTIHSFLRLGRADRVAASRYVFQNYRQMADAVDEDDFGCQIKSDADVWEHVHPSEIFVSRRPRRDQSIYVTITAECDWEREHGLQIIYRRGCELSRVSDQDGHLTHTDAYDLPEEEDRIA